MKNKTEEIFIEAYMRWEAEAIRGDKEGERYFQGGCDAIIMLAQMLRVPDEWIKENLIK